MTNDHTFSLLFLISLQNLEMVDCHWDLELKWSSKFELISFSFYYLAMRAMRRGDFLSFILRCLGLGVDFRRAKLLSFPCSLGGSGANGL